MMFKNFINKATDLTKLAKNLANGYLANQGNKSPQEIELEEKINFVIKETESLKDSFLSQYEKKLQELINELDKSNNEANLLQEENFNLKKEIEQYKISKEKQISKLEASIEELQTKNSQQNTDLIRIQETKTTGEIVEKFNLMISEFNLFKEGVKEYFEKEIKIDNQCESVDFQVFFEGNSSQILELFPGERNEEELNELKDKIDQVYVEVKNKIQEKHVNELNLLKENSIKIEFTEFFNKSISLISDKIEKEIEIERARINQYHDESLKFKEENIVKLEDLHKNYNIEKTKNEELVEINSTLSEEITELSKEKKNLESKIKETSDKLSHLEEERKNLQSSLESVKISFKNSDELCTSLCEKIKNLEALNSTANTQIEEKVQKYETSKQILKNILTLYLDDEIFIDLIEKCFKNNELNTEEIFKTSKVIKINLVVKLYKYIFNEILKPKLSKYKEFLKINNDLLGFSFEFKSLEQFYLFSEKLITDENNLLNKYFSEILENYDNTVKNNKETKEKLKKSKESFEEAKKTENENKEQLNNQIAKLQNDIKELVKNEKNNTNLHESLENSLKEEKNENLKLNSKIKTLQGEIEKLSNEKENIKELSDKISRKIDIYKLENNELIEKFKEKQGEVNVEKEANEILLAEKKELLNHIKELEKMKDTIKEKNNIISEKEEEIIKLKNSFENLEKIFENFKENLDSEKENLKAQLVESYEKTLQLEEKLKTQDEKVTVKESHDTRIDELNEKILAYESEINHLKEQKSEIKRHAEEVLVKVKNDLKDTEFLIDKRLISSFLIKYFDKNNNEKIRMSVLDTLANFVGFSNDERKKIGLNPGNGLFPTNNNDKLKDISDNLYNFILNA